MKRSIKITIAAVVLAGIGMAFWSFTRPEKPHPRNSSNKSDPAEQYEFLKALPYVQWTDTKGNESQRGVTHYDEKLAYSGYNLYTNDENEVYLTDMSGKSVQKWQLPGKKHCEYAELLRDGSIVVVCANQAIVRLDWNSKPIWDHKLRAHHDIEVLPDDSYFTLLRHRTKYKDHWVVFDTIIRVSPSGEILSHWRTADKIQEIAKFHKPHPMEIAGEEKIRKEWKRNVRIDYYHMNTVQLLPETNLGKKDRRFRAGNLIICFRNVDLIAILDQDTMEIVWTWGPGQVELPHMPTMLPSGNILIYDNGTRRKYSRIIELEPVHGRIVWEYKADPPESFFSHWQGSAQRLPNGNTLICESTKALAFEVTPGGKTVWRFLSPEVKKTRRKRIYRFLRLTPEYVEPILTEVRAK